MNKLLKLLILIFFLIILLAVPMIYGTIDFLSCSLKYENNHWFLTYSYRLNAYLNRNLRVTLDDKIINKSLFNYERVSYAYQGEAYFNPFVYQTFQREEIFINQDIFFNSMGSYVVGITFSIADASGLTSMKLREIQNSIRLLYETNKGRHNPLQTKIYYLVISISVFLFSIFYYLGTLRKGLVTRYIFTLKILREGLKGTEKPYFDDLNFYKTIKYCYDEEDVKAPNLKKEEIETSKRVIIGLRGASYLQKIENFPLNLFCYPAEFIYKKMMDLTHLQILLKQVKNFKDGIKTAFEKGNLTKSEFDKLSEVTPPASDLSNVSEKFDSGFTLIATVITITLSTGILSLFKSFIIIIPVFYCYILLNVLCLLYLFLHVNFKKIKNNRSIDFYSKKGI